MGDLGIVYVGYPGCAAQKAAALFLDGAPSSPPVPADSIGSAVEAVLSGAAGLLVVPALSGEPLEAGLVRVSEVRVPMSYSAFATGKSSSAAGRTIVGHVADLSQALRAARSAVPCGPHPQIRTVPEGRNPVSVVPDSLAANEMVIVCDAEVGRAAGLIELASDLVPGAARLFAVHARPGGVD